MSNVKPLRLFFYEHVKGFLSECTVLKVDLLQDRQIQFGGVYVCTFQPGNFTGLGSEGVKALVHDPFWPPYGSGGPTEPGLKRIACVSRFGLAVRR